MRLLYRLAAIVGLVLLVACGTAAPVGTTQNTSYSPREQLETAYLAYGAVLSAADGAVSSGKLPNDIEKKIDEGTQAATDALKAAKVEALKCWRDQATGVVGDAPNLPDGQHCNPSSSALLIAAAQGSIGNAHGLLTAFGVNVQEVK